MLIVIKKSVSTTNGNTKYDNHGGGKQCCSHPRIMDEVRDRLIAYIEHKLDLTRPDEINGEKHE